MWLDQQGICRSLQIWSIHNPKINVFIVFIQWNNGSQQIILCTILIMIINHKTTFTTASDFEGITQTYESASQKQTDKSAR